MLNERTKGPASRSGLCLGPYAESILGLVANQQEVGHTRNVQSSQRFKQDQGMLVANPFSASLSEGDRQRVSVASPQRYGHTRVLTLAGVRAMSQYTVRLARSVRHEGVARKGAVDVDTSFPLSSECDSKPTQGHCIKLLARSARRRLKID